MARQTPPDFDLSDIPDLASADDWEEATTRKMPRPVVEEKEAWQWGTGTTSGR